MRKPFDPTLCFVVEPRLCQRHGIEATVDAAIRGGATAIEIRDPELDDELFAILAHDVVDIVGGRVPVLLCSRFHLVPEVEADGVHLGVYDIDPGRARALLGPDRYVGLSVMAMTHLDEALSAGADLDFITLGTFFSADEASPHLTPVSPAVATGILAMSPWPAMALGGVTLETVPRLAELPFAGVGAARAISQADDPAQAAQQLQETWADHRSRSSANGTS